MMRKVWEEAPSRRLGPKKRQDFICSGEAEAQSRRSIGVVCTCDQGGCEELQKSGACLPAMGNRHVLEGVDCSCTTRGGKWEQMDEFSVIVGEIHPRVIRGLRPAGSKSLEATLEVVSEDWKVL